MFHVEHLAEYYFFRKTESTDISDIVTPEILEACPIDLGPTFLSRSFPSVLSDLIEAKSKSSGIWNSSNLENLLICSNSLLT